VFGSNTTVPDQILHVSPTPLAYKRRGRGGLNPRNQITIDAHWMKGFYPRRGLNLYKPSFSWRSIILHIREHPYSQI
jgi:hypothetical protein